MMQLQQLTWHAAAICWMALKGDELVGDVQGLNRTSLSPSERDGAVGTIKNDVTVGLIRFLD